MCTKVPYRQSGQVEACFVPKFMTKLGSCHLGDTDVSGGSPHRLGGKRISTQQVVACNKEKGNFRSYIA